MLYTYCTLALQHATCCLNVLLFSFVRRQWQTIYFLLFTSSLASPFTFCTSGLKSNSRRSSESAPKNQRRGELSTYVVERGNCEFFFVLFRWHCTVCGVECCARLSVWQISCVSNRIYKSQKNCSFMSK